MQALKVKFKNPIFIVQIILAVLGPILAYAGLTYADLTSWPTLGSLITGALLNPYVLGLIVISVWNAWNNPTKSGLTENGKDLMAAATKQQEIINVSKEE